MIIDSFDFGQTELAQKWNGCIIQTSICFTFTVVRMSKPDHTNINSIEHSWATFCDFFEVSVLQPTLKSVWMANKDIERSKMHYYGFHLNITLPEKIIKAK